MRNAEWYTAAGLLLVVLILLALMFWGCGGVGSMTETAAPAAVINNELWAWPNPPGSEADVLAALAADDSSWVYRNRTIGPASYYGRFSFPASGIPASAIVQSVAFNYAVWSTGFGNFAYVELGVANTDDLVTYDEQRSPGQVFTEYVVSWPSDPNTGGSWDASTLDSAAHCWIHIRVGGPFFPINLHEARVGWVERVVTYIEAPQVVGGLHPTEEPVLAKAIRKSVGRPARTIIKTQKPGGYGYGGS